MARVHPIILASGIIAAIFSTMAFAHNEPEASDRSAPSKAVEEGGYLSGIFQLTTTGRRSGEGYFSKDGKQLIYQSEQDSSNPFYQIYVMNLETKESQRVSPGVGMTTCAWMHPNGASVMYSSTHLDPQSLEKQRQEIERRQTGAPRPYAWDFDENYDIFIADLQGNVLENLTNARGYDAEGSWSPDGQTLVFASNRRGYEETLTPEEQAAFERDPSSMADIYVMDSHGQNIKRLTTSSGYDGGPFFSADGALITWRRFGADGRVAEVHVMNADGSNQRQVTNLGAMSWAPYFHPSGEYLIFATNLHGHRNFELYMVDTAGTHAPVRVTETEGFDGLPVFSPDGTKLSWTSTRHGGPGGQIFFANWNHEAARAALGIGQNSAKKVSTTPEISAEDLQQHVTYLASDELKGRMTGSEGEALTADHAESVYTRAGLISATSSKGFKQAFNFNRGLSLGQNNAFSIKAANGNTATFAVDRDFRPLAFSKSEAFTDASIVFAGYGINVPAGEGHEAYDSYVHLDVKDKWVMILRYVPENVGVNRRQYMNRFSEARRKLMIARDLGAKGVIFVSGPNSQVNAELIPLQNEATLGASSIFALSVTDAVAQSLLDSVGKNLKQLQDQLDTGAFFQGFDLTSSVSGQTEILLEQAQGHNVIGRLVVGSEPSREAIVIGAHMDHLGERQVEGTNEIGIHHGADDNASGTAAVLEIAEKLGHLKATNPQALAGLKRDIIFALWSGEELGLLGSNHFVRDFEATQGPLYPQIAANLNMDMIGRYTDKLIVQAVASSSVWKDAVQAVSPASGLNIIFQDDPYLPTDSTSFYLKGVPTLNAFTGSHEDYHTPNDTAEKLNYSATNQITNMIYGIAWDISSREKAPEYIKVPEPAGSGGGFRVYLGTIPDYSNTTIKGVLLSGVKAESPAEAAGLKAGDIILGLAGSPIENVYDYTYVLSGLRAGESVMIRISRNGEILELPITPRSRS
jgi:Tol biopolymer transport system component